MQNTTSKILKGYGLWLAGVASVVAAIFFLYRSRMVTWEVESDLGNGHAAGDEGLADRLEPYLPEPIYGED
jgi:hypothetical protein